MSDCIFCKMVSGEIHPDMVYEDEWVIAFRDIHPRARVHVLVIPRQHIATLNDLPQDPSLATALLGAVQKVAQLEGLSEGYRTVVNCGKDGGQEVLHLHFHVLGGRSFTWPPG